MNLVNHEPVIKTAPNGFQITFPNLYTIIIKNGYGAACTQTKDVKDVSDVYMASRTGSSGPDVEVEIYDPKKTNISSKFGSDMHLEFVTPIELAHLMYIVSSLK